VTDAAGALMSVPHVIAAGATGVACVIFGISLIAMQAGELIAGTAARNPALVIVKTVCGVAFATLGLELLILLHA